MIRLIAALITSNEASRLTAVSPTCSVLVEGADSLDLPPESWVRRGAMRGVTPSLIDLGTWLANHDRGHLVQLRERCGR